MIKQMKLLKNFLIHLSKKNQIVLEKVMRGSDFISDSVHLLYYNCYKMNLDHGGFYIDKADWIKKPQKATINPITIQHN